MAAHQTNTAIRRTFEDALLDGLPLPVLVHQLECIVYANQSACATFGAQDASELVGRHVHDIVHPHGHDAGDQRRELLFSHNQRFPTVPVKLRTLGGSTFSANVTASRFDIGGEAHALVAGATLNGNMIPHGGFIESPPAFDEGTPLAAAALAALPLPVVAHDSNEITYANRAALQALGLTSPTEVLGMAVSDLVAPTEREAERENRQVLLQQASSFEKLNARMLTPDGSRLYLTAQTAAIDFEDTRHIVWATTGVDRDDLA